VSAFHDLVASIDYPMFIVTAAAGARRGGCLVGFVTQSSIQPPRLLVCISKANATFDVASQAEMLAVHFLDQDDRGLARLFGEETGDEVDKFSRCQWEPGPGGVPVLPQCKGWVAGTIRQRLDCGDHVAHLLEPVDGAMARGDGVALTFQQLRDLKPGHPPD
jgi:flavin reductase (DIM6/NTAB) family NADH-FMN oxidoreductase RutF